MNFVEDFFCSVDFFLELGDLSGRPFYPSKADRTIPSVEKPYHREHRVTQRTSTEAIHWAIQSSVDFSVELSDLCGRAFLSIPKQTRTIRAARSLTTENTKSHREHPQRQLTRQSKLSEFLLELSDLCGRRFGLTQALRQKKLTKFFLHLWKFYLD